MMKKLVWTSTYSNNGSSVRTKAKKSSNKCKCNYLRLCGCEDHEDIQMQAFNNTKRLIKDNLGNIGLEDVLESPKSPDPVGALSRDVEKLVVLR